MPGFDQKDPLHYGGDCLTRSRPVSGMMGVTGLLRPMGAALNL